MNWSLTGAVLLALAVVFGAFGAHALREQRTASAMLSVYCMAVSYPFIHALGLLVVSFLARTGTFSDTATSLVCGLLLAGIVLFSGSLYALALTDIRALGAITPLGGLSFIAAWLALAW